MDGLTEQEIYEGLGVMPPEPKQEPAEEPGVGQAEPTGEPTPAPQAQEQAGEPAGEPGQGQEEPTGEQTPTPAPAPKAQEPAQTRINQEAIDRAYAEAYAGRNNPYTGQPIKSEADYQAYIAQFEAEQRRVKLEALKKAGVDPAAIEDIVSEHPVVKRAQEAIAQAEREKQQAQENEGRRWFEDQLAAINTLDPEAKIKDLEDLKSRDPEGFGKMLGLVRNGVSLVDAYKLGHFEELSARRASAAKQAALNQSAGKAHLKATGSQGHAEGSVEVPPEVRQQYRDMMPGITDEQIRKEYARYLKEIGE